MTMTNYNICCYIHEAQVSLNNCLSKVFVLIRDDLGTTGRLERATT